MRIRLSKLTCLALQGPRRDFHVRRDARDALGIDDSFFAIRGDVVFGDLRSSRLFAEQVNAKRRDNGAANEGLLRPSEVYAMGLMHEVLHAVLAVYRATIAPAAFAKLARRLRDESPDRLSATLRAFVDTYPPPDVYRGRASADEYLAAYTGGVSNEEWVLEELILLWVANQNPAYARLSELVSDEPLRKNTAYVALMDQIAGHFEGEPRLGPSGESVIELLLAPIRHAPDSLSKQLEFMRDRWGLLLGDTAGELFRLLLGLDFIAEEGRWFERKNHGFTKSDSLAPQAFAGELFEDEPERFSADVEWMPKVVMLAKSTFVWLDQLSKQYQRGINLLADIPDEELERMAARGFTALWLIGLWRRSTASRTIKQINGNPEAVASAYSLFDYEIAPELGGREAYDALRDRCARRGIRLASDMVPNHMGIDSSWVIHHPDWFIQSNEPPFPGYSFTGQDLSTDERVGIFIEDGYFSKSDAAVVFKRLDRHTGDVRFIYHGNDGTSMPWNDTAQLNYLLADVREAVIQTILHVARLFPIIRFDAAMTLAKRHYQRLWFPIPGKGGDIPSRAEHALTREQFDQVFPVEFWREVVDRVQSEVPGTLLLAEAFWMMEGYFVRTLGMHRVYNSAFMHMLKKEDNAAFRTSMKNVLLFNPQILKRHVNFMNNPDEDTAVAQFGKDDKYFGVCLMMSTLPGLPMFGHGQIEGYGERYGMEYKRAYWDEVPDATLVARHEREISPLLARRWLFSDVEAFTLYDMFTSDGQVDEDVFAYSNRKGSERTLIVYHNKFKDTRGWIRTSVGFLENGNEVSRTLAEGLGITRDPAKFMVFRDHVSGLEYIRGTDELTDKGLYIELGAFKYRAFIDFREAVDTAEQPYANLERSLSGAGVPSIDAALRHLHLKPLHDPFYEAIAPGSVAYLAKATADDATAALEEKLEHIEAGLAYLERRLPKTDAEAEATLLARFAGAREKSQAVVALLFASALVRERLGAYQSLGLDRAVVRAFCDGGASEEAAETASQLIAVLLESARDMPAASSPPTPPRAAEHPRRATPVPIARMTSTAPIAPVPAAAPRSWAVILLGHLQTDATRRFLQVNVHDGVAWFNKERFEALVELLSALGESPPSGAEGVVHAATASGYRLEPFIAALRAQRAAEREPLG